MEIGLAPVLTDAEKTQVRSWLTTTLADGALTNRRANFPLSRRLHIYKDGQAHLVHYGSWNWDSNFMFVGGSSELVPNHERLAVLAAIITTIDGWEQLAEAFSAAVSRTLLEQYNTMMGGLLVTRGATATGLAFSPERRQVAARLGGPTGAFYLPNGEEITPDDSWTLVQ